MPADQIDARPRRLVEENLNLAYHLARQFRGSSRLPVEDLAQEACLGLMAAAARYDPARGIPFGAYAQRGIVLHLRHARRLDRVVRVPRGVWRSEGAESEESIGPGGWVPAADEAATIEPDEVEVLAANLGALAPRAREVVWRRVALGQGPTEVAAAIGVTKQRIDQILRATMARLREAYGLPAMPTSCARSPEGRGSSPRGAT